MSEIPETNYWQEFAEKLIQDLRVQLEARQRIHDQLLKAVHDLAYWQALAEVCKAKADAATNELESLRAAYDELLEKKFAGKN